MRDIHRSNTNWFGRRAGRSPSPRPRHHSQRRRLTLEPLECRALLSATIWTVNSLGDTGTGSGQSGDLRYCIIQADQTNGDNTINFSVTGTITLFSALPDLSNTTGVMDIEGRGAESLTVTRSSALGTPDFGIFAVDSGANVELVGLTITGGKTITGGGVHNNGALTVSDCTIADNTATLSESSGGGGGILNNGKMTVTNCSIDNNSGDDSGGGIANGGTMSISDSTIASNTGGGGWDGGGGVYNIGNLTLCNSTIADNSGGWGYGGGICNGNQGGSMGTMTLTNCTITANSTLGPGNGGGVANWGPATLDNTIVALNSGGGAPDDIYGGSAVSSSSAYNLIGVYGSGGLVNGVNGNQVGVANPGLGTLADNGGPTQTIALLSGSPAIAAGSVRAGRRPQHKTTADHRSAWSWLRADCQRHHRHRRF